MSVVSKRVATAVRWLSCLAGSCIVAFACRETDKHETAAAAAGRAAVSSCQPSILLVARGESVEIANEWEKGDLFLIGCRDDLKSLTPTQRVEVTAALKSREQSAGLRLRVCKVLTEVSIPPRDVLAAANVVLGKQSISDWCWVTKPGDFW